MDERSVGRRAALTGASWADQMDVWTAEYSAVRSDDLSVASMAATTAVTMDACWAGLKAASTAMTLAVGMVLL